MPPPSAHAFRAQKVIGTDDNNGGARITPFSRNLGEPNDADSEGEYYAQVVEGQHVRGIAEPNTVRKERLAEDAEGTHEY